MHKSIYKSKAQILCFLFFVFSFLLICNYGFSQSLNKPDIIDAYIQNKMLSQHIPGLALAIIKHGQLVKERYYGLSNIENNVPVTKNSVFEIASMSKQFTCAAILLLQQEGKLSVSDKLSKYINNMPISWENITLYQLMNHTSGMRDDWVEETPYFLINHTDSLMFEAQKNAPLHFKPGTSFEYSSGPFTLGLVISNVTGKTYAQFLKEKIFQPLGMTSSSVYENRQIVPHRAAGYVWENSTLQNGVDISSAAEARGDVGVITSIPDMIKWDAAMNDNRLLNEESRKEMFTSGKLNNGVFIGYGYGWFIYPAGGQIIIEHGGTFRTGYKSKILRVPNLSLTVIILCNQVNAKIPTIAYEIATKFEKKLKLISSLQIKKDPDLKTTAVLQNLMKNVSQQAWNFTELYRQANFTGFTPEELKDFLKGFKNLIYIDSENINAQPLLIYNEKIIKIIYYKAEGSFPSYWSFAYNDKGKLTIINREFVW